MNVFFRWSLVLPIVVVALAVAYRSQQPLGGGGSALHRETATYCYQRVRTQDAEKPTAECFSVQEGMIQQVFTKDELASYDIDLEKRNGYVLPGLWDGHGHLLAYGEFLHSVDLFGSTSLDEVRSRIKAYLKDNPSAGTKDQWLRGVGWDQTAFGRMPTAVSI